MDRVLDVGGRFGLAGLSLAVFRAHMASRCPEEPVPRLHRNDQLWAVPAYKIPFNVGTALHGDRYPMLAAPILLAVAYGMAALSWRFLERPFLNLKRFFATTPSHVRTAEPQLIVEGTHAGNPGRLT